MISRDDIRLVVIETMNILEHEYDADLRDFGTPTVNEIVATIANEHFPKAPGKLEVSRPVEP